MAFRDWQHMPILSAIGRMEGDTSQSHKPLTGVELSHNDAKRQRLSPLGVKAGDRIRTDDVQQACGQQ